MQGIKLGEAIGVENFQSLTGKCLDGLYQGISSGHSKKELVKLGRQKKTGQSLSSGEFPSY